MGTMGTKKLKGGRGIQKNKIEGIFCYNTRTREKAETEKNKFWTDLKNLGVGGFKNFLNIGRILIIVILVVWFWGGI